MKETREAIWNAILIESKKIMKDDPSIVMYTDSEKLFHQNFNYYHSLIIDKFMKLRDKHLDRHKIAAIIICSILKSDILGIACGQESNQTIDDIFLANEKLALNIALSDMYQRLLSECGDGKIPYDKIFSDYVFPVPLSCDRDYTEVICRDLYFSKKYFELDPLSIANFLFLLEAYSFDASNIEININKWDELNKTRRIDQWEKELKSIEIILSQFDTKILNEKNELQNKKNDLQNKINEAKKQDV